MFPHYHNYIIFLFNPESLVVVCSPFFLLFAILQEKGQLGSYLQELSMDARSRIERHLAVRENMIQELAICLQRAMGTAKKMAMSYEMASLDTVAHLQCVIKKLLLTHTATQVKYSLPTIEERTQSLSLQIRFYSTHELFVNKSYNLNGLRPSSSEAVSLTAGAPKPKVFQGLDVPDPINGYIWSTMTASSDIAQCAATAATTSTSGMCGIAPGRKNITITSTSIESMPPAAGPNPPTSPAYIDDPIGQLSALLVLTVAAAESAIGLATLAIYLRTRGTTPAQPTHFTKG
jgi:NADH-quinone oxidoreductase subunit K